MPSAPRYKAPLCQVGAIFLRMERIPGAASVGLTGLYRLSVSAQSPFDGASGVLSLEFWFFFECFGFGAQLRKWNNE
jgi:hypothetical protein